MVRFKNRYFLIKVIPVKEIMSFELASPSIIANLIRSAVEDNFGVATAAKINPSLSVKFSSSSSHLIILRCAREAAKEVWSSLTFLQDFPRKSNNEGAEETDRAIWTVVGLSGTIRSCRIRAIKLHRKAILNALSINDLSEDAINVIKKELASTEKVLQSLDA